MRLASHEARASSGKVLRNEESTPIHLSIAKGPSRRAAAQALSRKRTAARAQPEIMARANSSFAAAATSLPGVLRLCLSQYDGGTAERIWSRIEARSPSFFSSAKAFGSRPSRRAAASASGGKFKASEILPRSFELLNSSSG